MQWDETTPINETNLNDLETRIAQADANVTAGKAAIASAITSMGQSANGSETYAQLAAHIADISDDANAAVSDVKAGKTFYQGGLKRTGNKTDNGPASAETVNLTSQNQEYTIAEGIHSGLRKIKAAISGLIAGVIAHGVNVGGITGNYDTEATNPITAATVLAPKKGRVNGAWVTGTMVDRAGDTAALTQTRSGTTIKLMASDGYRDGANDYVTHTDANDVAENIKAGVTIRGLMGTYPPVNFTPGDNVLYINTSMQQVNITSYVKAYEVKVGVSASYRIKFKLMSGAGANVYGRIYKNGVALGTERVSNSISWVEFVQDLSFSANDLVQMYIKTISDGQYVNVKDFTLCIAESSPASAAWQRA